MKIPGCHSPRLWLAAGLALAVACNGDGPSTDHEPSNLLKLGGDGQVGLTGTVLPESLVVEVVDGKNIGVPGVAISWSVTLGGGNVTPSAAVSDANGRLAARWTLGAPGNNAVTASAAGFTAVFNATATNVPPPNAALTIAAEPAAGQSGVNFPTQPQIQLTDQGNPISQPGIAVTVALAAGSSNFASLNGTKTVNTNASGRAVFTNLAITGPVGFYRLTFSAAGMSSVTSDSLDLTTVSGRIPLIDMGARTYKGFQGLLYNGSNTMPGAHAAVGAARARNVVPRALNGTPNANGQIVLMSIGMSNPSQEWCDVLSFPCNSWSFTGQAGADGSVDHTTLKIVNGARGGENAPNWVSAASPNYDRIRDSVLAPQGLSEAQVQVIWLKVANGDPTVPLPSNTSDAVTLLTEMGDIVRVLQARYPNLQIVFISSRNYAGYAQTGQNPEPYAYEYGFAVKWLIQAQIDQMANGGTIVDARAGNLNYNTVAPWIAWGPYFWADGLNPRSDGLTWAVNEFESDGMHPGTGAETKIGTRLLAFFKTDAHAACWFLANGSCP